MQTVDLTIEKERSSRILLLKNTIPTTISRQGEGREAELDILGDVTGNRGSSLGGSESLVPPRGDG